MSTTSTAAYGFRILGLGDHETLAVSGAPDWPALTVEHRVEAETGLEAKDEDDRSVIRLLDAELLMERPGRTATYRTSRPFGIDEVIHPYLVPAGCVFSRWERRETLHGGALAGAQGAWLVLGDKEAGKSSTLAGMAERGTCVLTDDMIVIEDGHVCAGPRAIDLRDDMSEHLGVGVPAGLPRPGGRNRVTLPPAPACTELVGVVYLAWGEKVEARRVPAAERLDRITAHRQGVVLWNDPLEVLDLAALPAYELSRPHGRERLAEACDALAGLIQR